jgi:hypothetical protein
MVRPRGGNGLIAVAGLDFYGSIDDKGFARKYPPAPLYANYFTIFAQVSKHKNRRRLGNLNLRKSPVWGSCFSSGVRVQWELMTLQRQRHTGFSTPQAQNYRFQILC